MNGPTHNELVVGGERRAPTLPHLARELVARFERDQAACEAQRDGHPHTLQSITRENAERMSTILNEHGWPGWRLVGVEGAQAAWLLVQHADHDLALQKRCVAMLDEAGKSHDAEPEHWAYLVDRVAVAENRPQVFGTQFDDAREPHPIEDEVNVDKRRASVGLEPLAAYRSRMWQFYGPPTR